MVTTGVFFVIYNFWILGQVKKRHEREMSHEGEMSSQNVDEGWVEKMERKANEPGLEPGSVV